MELESFSWASQTMSPISAIPVRPSHTRPSSLISRNWKLDIMGLHNATMQDFVNVTAHLRKIADTADLLISRVFLFNKAEATLPYRDGNRNALKIIIERD